MLAAMSEMLCCEGYKASDFFPIKEIALYNELYQMDPGRKNVLGTGSFGVVRRVMCRRTREWYAMKSMRRALVPEVGGRGVGGRARGNRRK